MSLTREAEAQHPDHALYFGLLEYETFNLLNDATGTLQRRAGRQLDVDQHRALVFTGQKRCWQTGVNNRHHRNDGHINEQVAASAPQEAGHQAFVAFGGACEAAIKPAKETLFLVVMTSLNRFEQGSAQGRCERKRQKRRKPNRRNHDGRKLAVNIAHRAREKRQGHKHRDQHDRYPDDGTRDLTHGFAGGFKRWQALFTHDALDVLNDHNRIVHHNTDHQHHAEHCQNVDGKPKRQQRGKSAQQCNRDNDGWNDGVAKVLQKQEHHQKH